ncbi:MAG: hypothetical protein JSS23_12265 [Proteobacteria bacterium]|nr:hypothetical protein [Pseudomonadota bacterium]
MDNTEQQTDSQLESDLLNLAGMVDRGEALPEQKSEGNQGASESVKTATTQGQDRQTQPQTGTAPASQPTDAAKQEAQPDQEGQQKRESEFTRFQKEKARFAKNWQGLQEERQRFEQEKAQIAQARQQLQQLRNTQTVNLQQPQADPGNPLAKYTDQQLLDSAETFEEEGKSQYAALARTEIQRRREALAAQQQRQALPVLQQQGDPNAQREQFLAEWTGHRKALEAQLPDLTKPESALFKEVQLLLTQVPYFSRNPSGIKEAVEAAQVRLEARAVPELRKRLEAQDKELTTLRKATSPGSGSIESRGAANKPFTEMTESEQIDYIRREAALADGS